MARDFNGLTVVSFESRRAREIEKLIAYHGGAPVVAPSMREVPLSEAREALAFADELIGGQFDVVILLTGVGTRALAAAIQTKYPIEQFTDALSRTTVLVRGPKPVAALRELGLKPDVVVPEPNTWRDILTTIDAELPITGKRLAVQEYGVSNTELLAGLRERGADVTPVPVYRWALPENTEPLERSIWLISEGGADVSFFTSSQQVHHLLQVAKSLGLEERLRSGFRKTLVGSIGPTTSETLREMGFAVDYEPDSPHMGDLVRETARRAEELLQKKRAARSFGVDTNLWRRVDMVWTAADSPQAETPSAQNSVFMKACRGERTDYTPIWLMRQAGRFMREYRELRARVSFLELCKTPELAAEVTLSAVDRLAVDAAIIFADILLIIEPLGVDLEFSRGDGPKIKKPVRSGKAVEGLLDFSPDSLGFVYEAVRTVRRALSPSLALIGFAGAPFTIASYMIEGGGSRNYENTKKMMRSDSAAWHLLMEKLSEATAHYLAAQIQAGADAVQIFDSWIGCLSPDDYREFVLPHMKSLMGKLPEGATTIHFGTGTSSLLGLMKEAGGSVIGLDWRVDLAEAWQRLSYDVAVQGNLDPAILFSSPSEIKKQAKRILDKTEGRAGHIFNLGHGILPGTPVDNVLALVDAVHEYSGG